MALIVVDASVVIAHLDPADALHHASVKALLEHAEDDLRLPASAYAEALVDPARKGRLEDAQEKVARLLLRIEPIGAAVAEAAARLRAAQPSLRLPDALVLACGEVLAAEAVLTADRGWRRFARARVVA